MLTTKEWEVAIICQDEGRKAHVDCVPGRRLPKELIPTALSLGYTASEVDTYSIGELKDDLVINGAIYLRGAIVLPDERGEPAAMFGKPLVKSPSEPCRTASGEIQEARAEETVAANRGRLREFSRGEGSPADPGR